MTGKEYLKANNNIDIVFETTDGTLFYSKSDAQNFAKTLTDTKVIEHKQDNNLTETPISETDEAAKFETTDSADTDAESESSAEATKKDDEVAKPANEAAAKKLEPKPKVKN